MTSLVWDMTMSWNRRFRDRTTLPRLRAAGFRVVGLTVGGDLAADARREAEAGIAAVTEWIAEYPDEYLLLRSAEDARRARAEVRLGIELNFQGVGPLEGSLGLVAHFHALGVRHIGLVWNDANAAGGSATRGEDTGLTARGRALVRAFEQAGILVDGAHAGHRTVMDAIGCSTKPFIISHANVAALAPSYKNLADDQILACAGTGGVIGVSGLGSYLDDLRATPEALFRQIDHIVQRVGPAHVWLGLDYVTDQPPFRRMVEERPQLWPAAGGGPMPRSCFFEPERVHDLARLMDAAGYTPGDVEAVLWGNWLRVAAACWRAA